MLTILENVGRGLLTVRSRYVSFDVRSAYCKKEVHVESGKSKFDSVWFGWSNMKNQLEFLIRLDRWLSEVSPANEV